MLEILVCVIGGSCPALSADGLPGRRAAGHVRTATSASTTTGDSSPAISASSGTGNALAAWAGQRRQRGLDRRRSGASMGSRRGRALPKGNLEGEGPRAQAVQSDCPGQRRAGGQQVRSHGSWEPVDEAWHWTLSLRRRARDDRRYGPDQTLQVGQIHGGMGRPSAHQTHCNLGESGRLERQPIAHHQVVDGQARVPWACQWMMRVPE